MLVNKSGTIENGKLCLLNGLRMSIKNVCRNRGGELGEMNGSCSGCGALFICQKTDISDKVKSGYKLTNKFESIMLTYFNG